MPDGVLHGNIWQRHIPHQGLDYYPQILLHQVPKMNVVITCINCSKTLNLLWQPSF